MTNERVRSIKEKLKSKPDEGVDLKEALDDYYSYLERNFNSSELNLLRDCDALYTQPCMERCFDADYITRLYKWSKAIIPNYIGLNDGEKQSPPPISILGFPMTPESISIGAGLTEPLFILLGYLAYSDREVFDKGFDEYFRLLNPVVKKAFTARSAEFNIPIILSVIKSIISQIEEQVALFDSVDETAITEDTIHSTLEHQEGSLLFFIRPPKDSVHTIAVPYLKYIHENMDGILKGHLIDNPHNYKNVVSLFQNFSEETYMDPHAAAAIAPFILTGIFRTVLNMCKEDSPGVELSKEYLSQPEILIEDYSVIFGEMFAQGYCSEKTFHECPVVNHYKDIIQRIGGDPVEYSPGNCMPHSVFLRAVLCGSYFRTGKIVDNEDNN